MIIQLFWFGIDDGGFRLSQIIVSRAFQYFSFYREAADEARTIPAFFGIVKVDDTAFMDTNWRNYV